DLPVGRRDIEIVEHRRHHPAAAFLPAATAVAADRDAAVVAGEDQVVVGPEQRVMVVVHVVSGAAIPLREGAPVAAGVVGAVQLHAAPDHAVWTAGMDGNRVVVVHLPFVWEPA